MFSECNKQSTADLGANFIQTMHLAGFYEGASYTLFVLAGCILMPALYARRKLKKTKAELNVIGQMIREKSGAQ